MKTRIFIVIVHFFLFVSAYSQEQQIIKGKVFDADDGTPLIGATVILKEISRGTVSDNNGEFSFVVSSNTLQEVTLLVSYIGYKSQSVPVNGKTYSEFFLKREINPLEEIVVTSSYGTKKLKQEVVGSISSIQPKDMITEQPAVSFDELLEGQAAGLYIETGEGVGGPVNIHIRGQGSLTSLNNDISGTSTQPLIIVDGIIMAEEILLEDNNFFDYGEGKYSEELTNPLAKIGITDIKSINVLKDAAAVSLYGADGANGVIIVTTKGGQKGPIKFEFSAQGGINKAMNRIKYMNGEQYQEIRNLFYFNNGQPQNVTDWNGVDTDWYELLNRTGTFQKYNISASGGTELVRFMVSGGYQNVQVPQVSNNYIKYTGGVSVGLSKNKFKTSLKLFPSFTEKNTPNTLPAFAVPPTIAPHDSSGNYSRFDTYGNPLAIANQNRALIETKSMISMINSSYQIIDGLKFSALFGIDVSNKNQDTYYSGLNETGIDNKGNIGERMLRDRNTRKWNWNTKLFYSHLFANKNYLDALVGAEARENSVSFTYHKGKNFPAPEAIMPIEKAEHQTYEKDKSRATGRSLFSQINYNYKKKYFILANLRIDQSSAFGADNNTAYNGGLGVSWNLKNEEFLKDLSWLTFLRIRTSYGTSGNSRIGSYQALGLYRVDETGGRGYNYEKYATPSTAPNPNLGWEKNNKFNIGADISISTFLSVSVDIFNDYIHDMIVTRDVIYETGYNNVQINGANMYNRGIELSIKANIINASLFKWTTTLNYTKIKNKVTHLEGLSSDYSAAERARAQKIGYPTSTIWGYDYLGVDPATGGDLYSINGNTVEANSLKENFDVQHWKPIGNSSPDFYGGIINRFKIGRKIEIRIGMSYSFGADKLIDKNLLDNYNNIYNRNMSVNTYYNTWRKPGDIAGYPMLGKNPLVSNSTKYLYSTSHIKLKSVNLSYRISLNKKKLPLEGFRIYLTGSNLYSWFMEKSPKGQNGIAELNKLYPEQRTYAIGINMSF